MKLMRQIIVDKGSVTIRSIPKIYIPWTDISGHHNIIKEVATAPLFDAKPAPPKSLWLSL